MCSRNNSQRPGFTMIELMVVIAIIALLMSLATGAMFAVLGSARENATATTVAKVHQILQERMAGFRQMDFSDAAAQYQFNWNASFPKSQIGAPQLAEVIVRKLRLRSAFPQNLSEVYTNTLVLNPRYSALSVLPAPTAGYTPNPFESGIVMYAMLTNGETFGAPSVGTDTFTSSEVKVDPTSGLPYLVDGWGNPLRFYRWPTRLFKPTGLAATLPIDRTFATLLVPNIGRYAPYIGGSVSSPNQLQWLGADGVAQAADNNCLQGRYGSDDVPNVGPDGAPGIAGINADSISSLGLAGSDDYEPLNVDSDDPWLMLFNPALGTGLLAPGPNNVISRTTFESGNSAAGSFWPPLHTPNTFHPFLVLSAGPDGQLGLFEPNDFTNFGYLAAPNAPPNTNATLTVIQAAQALADNITNLNLTGSGK